MLEIIKKLLGKNWVTTVAGVSLILGSIGTVYGCITSGGGVLECLQGGYAQIIAGLGLIAAKDAEFTALKK